MKMSVGFVEKGLSKFPLRRGNKGEDIYLFFEEREHILRKFIIEDYE